MQVLHMQHMLPSCVHQHFSPCVSTLCKAAEWLQVMFTPAGSSHAAQYKQGIPIKVTHNTKGPLITCTASSFMLKAVFEPATLDLGAILPCFDGQQPNQALLKLLNPSDVDMEVRNSDYYQSPQPTVFVNTTVHGSQHACHVPSCLLFFSRLCTEDTGSSNKSTNAWRVHVPSPCASVSYGR